MSLRTFLETLESKAPEQVRRLTAEIDPDDELAALVMEDLSLKLVVVVDDDVDVTRDDEVLWAMATRMQADRDVVVVANAMGAILDPSSRAGTTAKVVIDATRPPGAFPSRHTLPPGAMLRAAALLDASGTRPATPPRP